MTQNEMLTSAFPPTHNSSLPTDNNRRSTLESNPRLLKINAAHELSVADKPPDRKAHRLFQFQGSPLTSVRRLTETSKSQQVIKVFSVMYTEMT